MTFEDHMRGVQRAVETTADEVAELEREALAMAEAERRRYSRRRLLGLALTQRANPDTEFAPGFRIWTGARLGGWEFGPYLPRLWRTAITAKAIVCILLGRVDRDEFNWAVRYEGHVEVATFDVEESSSYWGGDWHYLKVRYGWRPRSWRYATGVEGP